MTGVQTCALPIWIAISLEKDSIVFYQSMKAVVPKTAGKDRLIEIIEQEIGHILILSRQIESLGK